MSYPGGNGDTGSVKFPPLPETPFVSIVIPVRNEEAFMEQCIASLKQLAYPSDSLEVIFADAQSTDRTTEIARSHGMTVVDNPGLKISAGRNAGFAAARGDVIAFTDADCLFDQEWVAEAVEHLRSGDIGGIGGTTRVPSDQDDFGKGVGVVFGLAGIAGGTVHFGQLEEVRPADDLPGCNAFYRREALETVMPTNTDLFSNEDVEMNAELCSKGVRLLLVPNVVVDHYKRSDPGRFWKQMYVFAIGRLQLGRRSYSFLKPAHWAMGVGLPFGLLFAVAALFLWPGLGTAIWLAVATCILSLVIAVSLKQSPGVGLNTVFALMLFVTAWPAGFLRELLFPVRMGYTSKEKPS